MDCPKKSGSKQSGNIHLPKKTGRSKVNACEKKFGSKQELKSSVKSHQRSARNGQDKQLGKSSGLAAILVIKRPSRRHNRVLVPQENVEEVEEEREENDEEDSEDLGHPDTPLPEHRVAALPVTVDSVDELQDEFCMQTSPELPRAEERRRIGEEEDVEEEMKDQGCKFCFFGSYPKVQSFFWLPKRVNHDMSCITTKVRKS